MLYIPFTIPHRYGPVLTAPPPRCHGLLTDLLLVGVPVSVLLLQHCPLLVGRLLHVLQRVCQDSQLAAQLTGVITLYNGNTPVSPQTPISGRDGQLAAQLAGIITLYNGNKCYPPFSIHPSFKLRHNGI